MNEALGKWIDSAGAAAPWLALALFLAASMVMIWRLEAMSARGMQGTFLGTLIMPYCSGLGNLIFAFVMSRRTWLDNALAGNPLANSGREVMTNCLVNNVTNLTLLIGLPAAIWGMSLASKKPAKGSGKKAKGGAADPQRSDRLALLLSVTAAGFFTGAVWALGRDGRISFNDGLVLIGLFLFWQCMHVFEALKSSAQKSRSPFSFMFFVDFALLIAGSYVVYVTTGWLVDWLSTVRVGIVNPKNLGWLSGWLMVLPNALLAFYYAWRRQPAIVYSSQVGDGHICIPLCIGLFALSSPISVPPFFEMGVAVLAGATAVHFILIAIFGGLPRVAGFALVIAYGVFVYKGVLEALT